MTISDLKNKIIAAQGVAKQVKIVRVYMQVTESTEESGKNILYTVFFERNIFQTNIFMISSEIWPKISLDPEEVSLKKISNHSNIV